MPYKDKEKQKERNREYQKKHYQGKKKYYITRAKERREKIKTKFDEYKKKLKCEICGENHIATLDFHHKNPSEKEISLSKVTTQTWGWDRIKSEIDKCIVLCSNCHRKLHFDEKMAGGGQGVPWVSSVFK